MSWRLSIDSASAPLSRVRVQCHRILVMCGLVGSTVIGAHAPADEKGEADHHGAHQHGVATLDVAFEDGRLQLQLESPAVNVVGFEHAPRTQAQREAKVKASRWLKEAGQLFALPTAANCRLLSAQVAEPAERAGERHQDYEASYTFECSQPQQLRSFDVRLVERLAAGTKLRVQVVEGGKQRSIELAAGRSTVTLGTGSTRGR